MAVIFGVLVFGTVQVFIKTRGSAIVWWLLLAGAATLALYAALALQYNRVTVSADPGGIVIARVPFPWFGSRFISRSQVLQLWVAMLEASFDGELRTYYELRARTPTGDVELVTEIESPQAALFLEREIEQHLIIAPEMVHGQYRPRRED